MNFYYDSGHLVNPRTYYNLDEQLIFKDIDRPNRETLLIDGSSYYRVCPPDDYQSSEGLQEARLESISRDEAGVGFSDPVHYTDGDIEAAYVSMVEFLDNSLSVSYKRVGRDGTTSSTVLDEMEVKDGNGMLVRTIRFHTMTTLHLRSWIRCVYLHPEWRTAYGLSIMEMSVACPQSIRSP